MITVSLTTCIVMSLLVSQSLSEPSSLSKTVSNLSSKLLLSMDKTTSAVENVIISPVSIFLALSLLYHGSDLSTKAELEDFLELDSQTDSGVATKALLLDYARSREALNTTIQLANGMSNSLIN